MHSEDAMRFIYLKIPMRPLDWLVDCAIAASSFGIAMLQLSLAMNLFVPDAFTRMLLGISSLVPSGSAIAVTFAMSALLVLRRRFPWPVFFSTLVIWLVSDMALGIYDLSILSLLVALFTICYEIGSIDSGASATICIIALLSCYLLSPSSNYAALMLFQNVSLSVAVALAGYSLNVRNEYIRTANERAYEAELLRYSESERAREALSSRESEAARRVEEERVRIARELHDITGHSLSAISIQSAAAERLIDADPQAAKQAVTEIRRISKSSLADIRSMVGVLRGKGEQAEQLPTQGTEQLGELVDYLEKAGISCDLLMGGYNRLIVPSHIDVALYGIAREACTNIVRHSMAKHASIMVETDACDGVDSLDGMVRLTIADDGIGMDPNMNKLGHGIDGMRERATLLGGMLTIKTSSVPGTIIEVTMPLLQA